MSEPYSSAATARGWSRSGSATSIATISASGANAAPKPSRKSSGTPITSATSAPPRPVLRAREKNSSWSAATHPRASPFRNTGIRSCSASVRSASSPCPQYSPVPAMIAGRSASAQQRRGALDRSRIGGRLAGRGGRLGVGRAGLAEHHVEREVEEHRSRAGRERRPEGLVDQTGDLAGLMGGGGELGQRAHERQVVELLQRALAPAKLGCAPAQHQQRASGSGRPRRSRSSRWSRPGRPSARIRRRSW